ncbi:MAG TPA: TRAP transporter substrate-binding protein [Falsiroseomonas sp.]|jgi:tripartite ATP-independent transporter DctP family solute receptor|nr:TRAP transporter substrate-binding protein [Falsiroseomonas sp.]
MTTITRRGLGLAAAGLALATPGVACAQAITMNLGHVLSATSAYQVIFERFKELAAERTNGRVTVNIQGGGAAGNEGRLIQSLRTGVIDGAFVGGSSLETVVRDYRVLSLPYVFDDHPQANRVLQGAVGEDMLALLEPLGMLGLGFGAIFERNIAGRRPIRTPADLQGLKIRVLQTPGFVEAYRVLGTQATPMAYGEVFLALQNGVVDALEISSDAVVADRFVEVIQRYALTKVHQSTTVFAVSGARFRALPADVQATLRTAAKEAIRHGLGKHEELNVAGLATVRARGITVHEPDLEPFKVIARRSYDAILAEAPNGRAWVEKINAAKRAA